MLWLSKLDEYCPILTNFFEYDEEADDLVKVFTGKKLQQNTKTNYPIGSYVYRDMKFPRPVVDRWISKCKEVYGNSSVTSWEEAITLPSGAERYCSNTFQFVGMSENGTASYAVDNLTNSDHPIFFCCQHDITKLKNIEIELEKRKKELQSSIEEAAIWKCFFQTAPVAMAIIQVVDDGKDASLLAVNPWLNSH
jgi:hypothetical protein